MIVLTLMEHCLNCGAYEATALGCPMVLSDTAAIRRHFKRGACYAKPTVDSIRTCIVESLERHDELSIEASDLKRELIDDWCAK